MNELLGKFTNNVLIEFDMIVDTEFGLLRLIRDEYANENFFFKTVLNYNNNLLKGILMERAVKNPLQVAFRDDSLTEQMDSFYNQFMDTKYDDILKRSSITNILKLIKLSIDTSGPLRVSVLCRNKKQKAYIAYMLRDCLSSLYSIIYTEDDVFDVSKYDVLFIDDIKNIIKYSNVYGKTIYLSYMYHNIDLELEKTKVLAVDPIYNFLLTGNEIKFITKYKYDNSYSVNRNFTPEMEDFNQEDDALDDEDIKFIENIFGGN